MRKKKSLQGKFRKTNYSVHQYWSIHYTEAYNDGTEKDFKTFIKAKSYFLAKHILKSKVAEDNPSAKLKSIQGFKFHDGFKMDTKRSLGMKGWAQIRAASFPNVNNYLFKHEAPRPKGRTNRFNTTDYEHIKTIGFGKGKKNWSHINRRGSLPKGERVGKIYRGYWQDWDKDLMKESQQKIVDALIKTNNNRSAAARLLGMGRHGFYSLMSRLPVDWDADYPAINPFKQSDNE